MAEVIAVYGVGMQCTYACGEADYARALAHWAKVELLKEKVKQRLDAKYGKNLDRIADLIVEIVAEQKRSYEELEEKEERLQNELQGLGADGE